MPELPEVEITKRKLEPLILGKAIADFSVLWPKTLVRFGRSNKEIRKLIVGQRIQQLSRHGKVLYLWLEEGGRGVVIHQKMSGHVRFTTSNDPPRKSRPSQGRSFAGTQDDDMYRFQSRHARFVLKFFDGSTLTLIDPRKFGRVWIGTKEDFAIDPHLGQLGPDTLSLSFPQFQRILVQHKKQLKALLLDQRSIAGLGNITVDESLWLAKIHPKRLSSTISAAEAKRLFRAILTVLHRVIRAEGTSMRQWFHPDGGVGRHQNLFRVYNRAGRFCQRCRTEILRISAAGRSTFLCPRCQTFGELDPPKDIC